MKKKILETLKHWLGLGFIRDVLTDHEVRLYRLTNSFNDAMDGAKLNRGIERLEAVEMFVAELRARRKRFLDDFARNRDARQSKEFRLAALESKVAQLSCPPDKSSSCRATEISDSDRLAMLSKKHEDLHRDFYALLGHLKLRVVSEPTIGFTGDYTRVVRKDKQSKSAKSDPRCI
jgi:hypothetical protein